MATLTFRTERRTQLLDVTERVREAADGNDARAIVLFVPHTTAGLVVQATGAGAARVAADIEAAMQRLVDESWSYEHVNEGDRNPWAHVRAALTASSLTIPLQEGALAPADLPAIFFCEFDGPRERSLRVTLL